MPRRRVAKPRFGSELEHVRRCSVSGVSTSRPSGVGGARAVLRALPGRPGIAAAQGAGVVARTAGGWDAVVHDAFGRDTLITWLQTTASSARSSRQPRCEHSPRFRRERTIATIDAEPARSARAAARQGGGDWFAIYYGTVDATPLFLVLLSEIWRWTGDDDSSVKPREPRACGADWMDRCGDRRRRLSIRASRARGENQCGKTRATRSASREGRPAEGRSRRQRCRDSYDDASGGGAPPAGTSTARAPRR